MHRHLFICILLYAFSIPLQAQNSLALYPYEVNKTEAWDLYKKEKYATARAAFEVIQQSSPHRSVRIEAEYYTAICALKLYNPDGEALLEAFVTKYPTHTLAQKAYYDLGIFFFEQNEYSKAVKYFKVAEETTLPDDERNEVDFKIAYSYFNLKQFDKALPYFDKAKRTEHGYTAASYYYAGFIAYRSDDFDKAAYNFEKAETSPTYKPVIPSLLTSVYYKQGRYDQVISYATGALKRKDIKNKTEIELLLADAYFEKADFQNAAIHYNAFVQLGGKAPEPRVLYRMGFCAFKTGNNKEAIANFKLVALTNDTLAQYASYYLGATYIKDNNKQYAISAFQKAGQYDVNKSLKYSAILNYAKLSVELGLHEQAIDALQSLPRSSQTDEVTELISESLLQTRNYERALEYLDEIGQLTPRMKAAYQKIAFLYGTDLFNQSKYKASIEWFDKSLQYKIDQNYVIQAYFWEGESYSTGKKYEEAINAYSGVFRSPGADQSPFYLRARYGIGYAYYNTQAYQKALVHFKYFVQDAPPSDPFRRDAVLRLADCYYVTKNYPEAVKYYDQIIATSGPDIDHALFQKGLVYSFSGDYDRASVSWKILLTDYPKSRYVPQTQFELANARFETGAFEPAIVEFTTLINKYPNSPYVPFALLKRAIAQSNLKNYPKAIESYSIILVQYPSHSTANSALRGLQEMLVQSGRSAEFDTYLVKYRQANPDDKSLESIEFEAAKGDYFAQNYDAAIQRLEKFMIQYPQSGLKTEGQFYLAESFYRKGQIDKSISYYTVVANGNSLYNTRALRSLGDIYFDTNNMQQAIANYERLAKQSNNKKESYRAVSGLMKSYYVLQQYDSSLRYANIILQEGEINSAAMNEANLYVGKNQWKKGNTTAANEAFMTTLNGAKDRSGAEAQYLMALILNQEGKYAFSNETLYDLNKNFGGYDDWLGKSFLLISDNFIALNEVLQAEVTLNSLIEYSPIPEVVKEAKAKMATLKNIKIVEIEVDTVVYDDNE